ncbi:MAG: hypothetical protein R3304_09965 [Longimicrobiales bacterium]|nr:hypothetical protein [Longimicrobiales bacterium]
MPVAPTIARTFVRILVILFAIAGACGHLAYLDALWWHSLGLTATMARDVGGATLFLLSAHAAVSMLCAVLAVVLVLREGHRADASRALGIAFGAWSYLMAYSGVTMLFRPQAPGPLREVFEAHFLVVEMLGLAALLRFTSIFPRRLGPDEVRPAARLPAVLLPFHRFGVLMRRSWAPWTAAALTLVVLWSWTVVSGGDVSDAGLSPLMDVVRFTAAGLVVAHLHRAWTVATEGDRDGLMWLAAAFAILLGSLAILMGGNVLVAVTGFPEPDVAWRPILLDIGSAGFFAGLAMSVLQEGGRDPARITRKVTAATVIVTMTLFFAAALEALLTGAVFASYALRTGVGTAVAFAVALSTYRSSARAVERVLPI